MEYIHIAIIIIVIIVIIWYYRKHYHNFARKSSRNDPRARTLLASMDTMLDRDRAEQAIIGAKIRSKTDVRSLGRLSSDDLFTLALIHLHRANDATDSGEIHTSTDQMAITKQLLTRALDARKREERRNHVVTNATLIARANDIGITQAIIDEVALLPQDPIVAPEQVEAHQVHDEPRPVVQWTPDAENVHDSAIGDDVMRRIAFLRERDLAVFTENMCIGTILRAMNTNDDIKASPNADTIKRRVRQTLNVMATNNYCERYKITELNALRLALERMYSTKSPEVSHNIEASIIRALADCSDSNGGTVCLVGRITRIIGALDVIDPDMPSLKTTDAYRAEIMQMLGNISRQKTSNGQEITKEDIDDVLANYRTILPEKTFANIRDECYGALI